MQDHTILRDDFQFSDMSQVPAQGISGGLVIMWHHYLITVDEIQMSTQEIHHMVHVWPNPTKWLFLIYASNSATSHATLWNNLKCIQNYYTGPWFVGGDFNEVLRATEEYCGNLISNRRADAFANCINYCKLIDLGFKDSCYMWTNTRRYGYTILERLDCLLTNYYWINLFPEVVVQYLPRTHSDHCPLLVSLQPNRTPKNKSSGLKQYGQPIIVSGL